MLLGELEQKTMAKEPKKPSKAKFLQMMKKSQAWAKKAGLTQKDVKKAILEARKQSKRSSYF